MGKKFCPNKKTERKADHALQGDSAAQTRLSEAQSELDGRAEAKS